MYFGEPETYEALLRSVRFPEMFPFAQVLTDDAVPHPGEALRRSVREQGLLSRLAPGQRVAVAVGSRELASMVELVRTVVGLVREAGAEPFLVPSMGSHGGATAEGQRAVLEHLGVTPEAVGAPIRSSMETVEVGRTPDGLPVHLDRLAFEADSIIPVNRVKPHTDFRGPYESGLLKMLAIGLGKQHGADICHSLGFPRMSHNVLEFGKVVLATGKIAFFAASVENEFHHAALVEAVAPERVLEREPELLDLARGKMPRIPFDKVDLIVVDHMGKDLSGTGMDTNVVGRSGPLGSFAPFAERIVVFSLTEKTGGNANGMGLADIASRRLADEIDFAATYPNGITSNEPFPMRMPVILPNDRLAYRYGIKACVGHLPGPLRVVHIRDTLSTGSFFISRGLAEQAGCANGPAYAPAFDAAGTFIEYRPIEGREQYAANTV